MDKNSKITAKDRLRTLKAIRAFYMNVLETKDKELALAVGKVQTAQAGLDKLQNDIAIAPSKITSLDREIAQLMSKITEREVSPTEDKISDLKRKIAELEAKLAKEEGK